MAFKVALLCVVACLVQQSLASCYLPRPSSCNAGKVIVKEIDEISYKQIPIRPKSTGKVIVKEIEEIEKIRYNPIAVRPTSISSNCVSIDIPNYGGSLAVSSVGPISPSGIAVATDLGLAGDVVLSGELPYLSAVAFEGQFATSGAVPVAYGCGDYVGITEQIGGIAGSGSYIGGNIGASPYGSSYLGCGCKY
ncbi:chorion class B protein PC10-like [Cydia pomonella]|uniref:chorion class B protein PC10-like n=1 Tax=Cydia pomonella TaxID=82600 RepID=UPI002ADE1B55|nr:chorion class B protein PC10-like [Cydia pomonella]